ncbi:MAG TPA: type II toxin-antitoxin system PemK/MazF family toxin [Steroidobacteraceae bacterium]|jgi:mRNA interferase MazF|nr:type II toxin-antitoxin system PemK/MazF family toxin [Steroidobacteraceae bacterium]
MSYPRAQPGPALVIQTDALNKAGHPTTIVVPGTSQVDASPPGDHFPLRVRIQKTSDLKYDTELLIDQFAERPLRSESLSAAPSI